MREAEVGASPGPGRRPSSPPRARGRKPRPRPPPPAAGPRQQRADHAGQHVAGAGGGRPRLPGRAEVDRTARIGDDRDVPLEQHRGAERVGQLAARAHPVITGGVTRQTGEFTRVRGQHRRRAAFGDQFGMGRQDGQPVGVHDHRQVGVEREPQRRGPGVVGAQPRPDDQGLHPPGRRGGGRGDHLGPLGEHLAVRAAGVADHPGGRRDGGAGTQHGRTRVRRRAGHHAGDTLGVLVVVGSRHRPACRHVGGLEAQHVRGGQVQADVDQPHPPALAERVHGFEPAEGDGQDGAHGGAAGGPGGRVDATGDVDGNHRDPRVIDRGEHLGRGGPQRSRAGDAHDTVDDEIGCGRDAFDDPAAGPAERRQPLAVGALGLSRIASAAAPRRRTKVAAHSASPPLSPEPTTAHTRRPLTPPVRAANSPMISAASP
ncbi:hypothetical protein I550_4659 [Mycobacterium intracellulare 1956]|uniref:Uncharacterized protein n=1 Tax=Mycobacterium intracellulare 1956 TaxID=1299331 RepID=X8C9K1_MYCIT|nr:hypothetical protein I550_4659 [Mycobacterium intracellulare 1956]